MADAVEVHVTMPDGETARRIGRVLVEERLAACVNIVQGVVSIYSWKGQIQEDEEVLCLFKTSPERFSQLRTRLLELHPYELPEVLGFAVDDGSQAYVNWVRQNTDAA
jgi:periplasmic divalent cation tolerance protein